jgi:N utilization substance protein A
MELIVPDEKLSLAIGKKGQNVRLASQLTGWRIDIHSESKVRELEEQAKRHLAEIDGVSEDLADTMFKLGWRSADELASADPQELVAIPGLGGAEAAQHITQAAKVAVEIQRERAAEEARRLEQEGLKSDEERMLSVDGVDEELAERLRTGGYGTVEQLAKEHDMNRLAENAGLTVGRAKLLHWEVRVYLGQVDRQAPPPKVEEEELVVGLPEL